MNLTIIDKIISIIKYTFSSFLSIEMFIMCLLLFCILIFSLKKNNKFAQMIIVGIFIGFLIGITISYSIYVSSCIDSFFKEILNYIYFPSTVVYFIIIVFVTIMLFYTVFSNKLNNFKKIINYIFFSILYYLFFSFIALSTIDGIDLINVVDLYKNNTILSIVQISNFILLIWIIYTCFYHLFIYFRKNYD